MAISYAKKNNISFSIREMIDSSSDKTDKIPDSITDFYVDPRFMIKDKEDNFWIYSPVKDRYYLYYLKEKDVYTMTCYPTITASINPECKLGLRLYTKPKASSESGKRIKGRLQITADIREDESGNIWAYTIKLDNPKNPTSMEDGWVLYKTGRNNFLNLQIRGDKKIITNQGHLDYERLNEFKNHLFLLDNGYKYRYGENWLQFFGKTGIIPVGEKMETKPESSPNSSSYTSYGTNDDTRKMSTYWSAVNSNSKSSKTSKYFEYKKKRTGAFSVKLSDIENRSTKIMHTSRSFPDKDTTSSEIPYKYNYEMDYLSDGVFAAPEDPEFDNVAKQLQLEMRQLYRDANMDIRGMDDMYKKNFTRYNRFKLSMPDDYLSRGFAHIFITKPDCNLYQSDYVNLIKKVKNDPNFGYAFDHRKRIINSLTQHPGENGDKHDWNLLLSNKAEDFSLSDESITTETTPENFMKQKIVYGKTSYESKSQGECTVKYTDNRDLDIYHMHKLWTDYIDKVYSGKWLPRTEYIWGKIIDYASSLYYVLTAEDGETIIFWSKYYGIFPVNLPSSQYSWSKGQPITSPEVSITYQYSLKEDFNPLALAEINANSHISSPTTYDPIYNPHTGSSGYTWVGAPYIDMADDHTYRLRFKHAKSDEI